MKYDTSLQRKPIRSYEIHGIASMMRDLERLTEDVPAIEAAILATQRLDHLLRADLEVRSGDQLTPRVGDVVLFRALELGPYADMETTWGDRVTLVPGRSYIGVLCERNSTKYFAASFGEKRRSYHKLVLQFVAQAPAFAGRGLDVNALLSLRGSVPFFFLLNGWNEIPEGTADAAGAGLPQLVPDSTAAREFRR